MRREVPALDAWAPASFLLELRAERRNSAVSSFTIAKPFMFITSLPPATRTRSSEIFAADTQTNAPRGSLVPSEMNFDRYTSSGAQLAVSLVNAYDLRSERGRPGPDLGPSGRLERLDAGLPREAALLHPPAETDDGPLRQLARALRAVFTAGTEGRADDAARSVNALLARHRAAPVLSDHDAQPWHLHFTARGALPADAWGAQASTALAVLIAAGELARLGICAADRCDVVFLDTSKNGSRRFCSEACATRTKVASWRARRAVGPPASGAHETPEPAGRPVPGTPPAGR